MQNESDIMFPFIVTYGEEPENSYNEKLYPDLQETNNSDEKLQTLNREYRLRLHPEFRYAPLRIQS